MGASPILTNPTVRSLSLAEERYESLQSAAAARTIPISEPVARSRYPHLGG